MKNSTTENLIYSECQQRITLVVALTERMCACICSCIWDQIAFMKFEYVCWKKNLPGRKKNYLFSACHCSGCALMRPQRSNQSDCLQIKKICWIRIFVVIISIVFEQHFRQIPLLSAFTWIGAVGMVFRTTRLEQKRPSMRRTRKCGHGDHESHLWVVDGVLFLQSVQVCPGKVSADEVCDWFLSSSYLRPVHTSSSRRVR